MLKNDLPMALSIELEITRSLHKLLIDHPELPSHAILLINVQYLAATWLLLSIPILISPASSSTFNAHKGSRLLQLLLMVLSSPIGNNSQATLSYWGWIDRKTVRIVTPWREAWLVIGLVQFQVGEVELETHELLGAMVQVEIHDSSRLIVWRVVYW